MFSDVGEVPKSVSKLTFDECRKKSREVNFEREASTMDGLVVP